MKPQLWIVAGPNGAGKTTLTNRYMSHRISIINPDVIQRELSGGIYQGSLNMLAAGRIALQRREELLQTGRNFAIETTFTGKGGLDLTEHAKSLMYKTSLIFVGIENVETSSRRVKDRVSKGGHDVSAEDQVRRFDRSLGNMAAALPQVDRALIMDNSGLRHSLLISIENQRVKYVTPDMPEWAVRTIPARYRSIGGPFRRSSPKP